MRSADSDSISTANGSPERPPGHSSDLPAEPQVASLRLWALMLGFGTLAGLVAWLGGELCLTAFKPPRHAFNSKGIVLQVTDRREEAVADAKNAALAFALLGGAVGASLGAAGGIARGSNRAAASAALFGLAIGVAGGLCASLILLPMYNVFKATDPDKASTDMLYPLLLHAGIWATAGIAGGLAFARGFGVKGISTTALMGGMIGVAIATVAYEMTGVAFFPEAQTTQFISTTWQTRLFARISVAILAALGIAIAIADPRSRPGAAKAAASR